jgi:hypothetical protein
LAIVNCRGGPKCASMGLAQEALVGVKHNSTLFFFAQRRILVPLWGGEVVQDDVDRGAVGAGGADRLQGRESVDGAFAAAVDAPRGVVTDGVAAVEVGDAVGAVVGRRQPVGPALFGPAGACGGTYAQRAELLEGERAVREVLQDVFDPVEFGVALGVGGLFPRLGALESDPAAGQQHPQGLTAYADHPAVDFAQVGDEFA